jgi:HSP20 family protein
MLTKTPESPVVRNGDGQTRTSTVTPMANILETKEGYLVEAEMPGVSKDGLELTVENGELAIVGRRSTVKPVGTRLYRESRDFDFRRVFELDPSIDTSRITAKLEHGILKVHLPKTEAVKPRRIAVTD